jgi:hypothetical protein
MTTSPLKHFCLLIAIGLAGCATDVANRYYAPEKYPPKEVEQVDLLRGRPSRQFVVIADFQSRGESPQAMRKRAAKIGADAIIVTNLGGYASLTTEWAGEDPYSNTYSRLIGTAIKYK